MSTDPISDLLVRIKNSMQAGKDSCRVSKSRIKEEILEVLKNKGYIYDFHIAKGRNKYEMLNIVFSKDKDSFCFKRVSRPGKRVYTKNKEIKKVLKGYGINIISTSKGIMSGDKAKKMRLGGEIICEIY